jgi:hypothetical protein
MADILLQSVETMLCGASGCSRLLAATTDRSQQAQQIGTAARQPADLFRRDQSALRP